MSTGIILFAHGARDPNWARPLERLKRMLAERMPEALIEAAFLEHMTPTLEDAASDLVARGATELSVVPVFIANGGHLREDLPGQPHQPLPRPKGSPVCTMPSLNCSSSSPA